MKRFLNKKTLVTEEHPESERLSVRDLLRKEPTWSSSTGTLKLEKHSSRNFPIKNLQVSLLLLT